MVNNTDVAPDFTDLIFSWTTNSLVLYCAILICTAHSPAWYQLLPRQTYHVGILQVKDMETQKGYFVQSSQTPGNIDKMYLWW